MLFVRVAVAAALVALCAIPPSAAAHEGNPNYRSQVRSIAPAIEGVSAWGNLSRGGWFHRHSTRRLQRNTRSGAFLLDPEGMKAAELHFHLLPGVDDGPAVMEDSLGSARTAAAEGTRTIVATPHVRADFLDRGARTARAGERGAGRDRREGLPLEVRCGAELGHEMVARLRPAELEAVAEGPPDARWILVESPFELMDDGFHEATAELRARGYGVLVAHPERSADASVCDGSGLRRELAAGALAQVNAMSIAGRHGEEAAALRLVREGRAAVVASDAHGPTRPPALLLARRALIAHGVPERVASSLTLRAGRRLLRRGIARAPALAA